jgi:hypothetical protein
VTTPRRSSTCLVALSAAVSLGLLIPSPAAAAEAHHAVEITSVSASSEATANGADVSTIFTVKNLSGARQGERTAHVSLVDVDRERGTLRAYRLATVRTPALTPGSSRTVRVEAEAPRATTAGRYHVRVCFTRPSGDGPCALSPRASVRIGEAVVTTEPASLEFAETEAGASSEPQDVVVSNEGQSRTNGVRLALSGSDAADFTVARGTCTTWLAPGESCTAEATFSPVAGSGARSASLLVGGGGRGGSVDVAVSGSVTVEAAITMEPATWDYGSVPVGGSATHTFLLVNHTDTDDTFSDGHLDSTEHFWFDYVDGQNTCLTIVIPAHGSCSFSVAFVPQSAGPVGTTVTFSGTWGSVSSVLSGSGAAEPVLKPARRPTSSRLGFGAS